MTTWRGHQHLDAERSVLGAMILGADTPAGLSRRSFFNAGHGIIFDTLSRMSGPRDFVTICAALTQSGELALAGGRDYLAGLIAEATTAANVTSHAAIVLRLAQQRDLKAMALALAGDLEADSLPNDLRSRLDAMAELAALRVRQRAPRRLDAIYDALETTGAQAHVPLGFEKFADLRISPGDLFIIGARPGGGKTAMMTTIAGNASAAGWQALFLSLEMDATLIGRRLKQAGVPVGAAIWIEDDPALTDMDLITAYAKAFVHTYPDRNTVVLVDYLQLVRPRGRFDRRHEAIGQVCRDLKQLARALDIPVIAGAQLSRAPEQRGKDSKPLLSDLRESGEIENTADEVLLLHREDRETLAKLAKYRMGERFTARIFFNPRTTTFEDHEWQ